MRTWSTGGVSGLCEPVGQPRDNLSYPTAPSAWGLDSAFVKYLGPDAVDGLSANMALTPVVLVGGNQLTGKSKVTPAVARLMGGRFGSTGGVVRHLAAERSVSIECMSKLLAEEPHIDVRLDYAAAHAVSRGDVVAYECRMAGSLALLLRRLGRAHVASVYLSCEPWERALRHVSREVGRAARQRVEPQIAALRDAPLHVCLETLANDIDPRVREVARRSVHIAARDASDRDRLLQLYGVDFRDASIYDIAIDTTYRRPAQTRQAVIDALQSVGGTRYVA